MKKTGHLWKRCVALCLVAVLLLPMGYLAPSPVQAADETLVPQNLNYTENPVDVPNPDRGFYRANDGMVVPVSGDPGDEIEVGESAVKVGGVTVETRISHIYFDLRNFSSNAYTGTGTEYTKSYQAPTDVAIASRGDANPQYETHFDYWRENVQSTWPRGTSQPLTQDALDYIRDKLQQVRDGEGVAIIRFNYDGEGFSWVSVNHSQDGSIDMLTNDIEPDKETMLTQIAQLKPILEEYEDVIMAVDCGMFGPWGEMHSTTFATSPEAYAWLLDAWLDAVPESRSILVHGGAFLSWYNNHYGTNYTFANIDTMPVPEDGSPESRFGFFNDSYAYGCDSGEDYPDDWGSLSEGVYWDGSPVGDEDSYNRGKLMTWIRKQNNFYGGEAQGDQTLWNSYPFVGWEASYAQTVYLNADYDSSVHKRWANFTYTEANVTATMTNTYDDPYAVTTAIYDPVYSGKNGVEYFRDRLGYRLVLRDANASGVVAADGTLRFEGKIQNVGFGNIVNKKAVSVILAAKDGSATYTALTDIDARTWTPALDSRATNTAAWHDLSFSIPLSQFGDIPAGEYNIYLKINDPKETSATKRSIRFANYDLYNEALGANLLGSFTVSSAAEPGEVLIDSGLSYTEGTAALVNPERGFYQSFTAQVPANSSEAMWSEADFAEYTNEYSVFHLRFGLEQFSANAGYSDIAITAEGLASLEATLDNLRKAGGTCVLRFSYNVHGTTSGGDYCQWEPSIDLIETHIAQLGPIIENNLDVIMTVDSGMLGPWGEQHGTTLAEDETAIYRVVEAWLNAVPSRTIGVRRPLFYTYWYNQKYNANLDCTTLSSNVPAEGTPEYRVGVYNDGYLGSSSDCGTFVDRDEEIAWLTWQTGHTFYGGEVVSDRTTGLMGDYNTVDYLESEAFKTHTTYLNIEWNDSVLAQWKASTYDGADTLYHGLTDFDYAAAHLGYRFVLRQSQLSYWTVPGGQLNLQGKIENVGFGNVINDKIAEVILTSGDNTYVYPVDLDAKALQSQTVSDYSFTISLPADIAEGTYSVYLRLRGSDEKTVSAARTIQFANNFDIYNETLGANLLGSFTVSNTAIPAPDVTAPSQTTPTPVETTPAPVVTTTAPTVTESSYVHNFTESGTSSSFYTLTGSTSTSKGTASYNSLTLTTCLKMSSSASVAFTAPVNGNLTLVFAGSDGATLDITTASGTSTHTISGNLVTLEVPAGSVTVKKNKTESFLFYIVYTPESTGEDTHTHSYTSAVTAPTCTAQGYTTYTCECGDSYVDDYVAATGHSYADGACSLCGAIDPNSSTHTHSYTSVVTAPTCTAQGYTTYTCACGESYVSDYVDATSHSYADGACSVCGAADPNYVAPTEPPVVTPASAEIHNFTANGTSSTFYSITGSTSTSKGSVTYDGLTLTTCLKMESKTNISFTAPSAGTLTLVFGGSTAAAGKSVKVDGTSYDVGTDGTVTVDVAAGAHTVTKGDSINLFYMVYTPEGGSTEPAPHEHSYTSSVTTAATCENAGVMTYTCSCGDSYTESIAALGHSYTSVVTAPTCTAGGYTTYTCGNCGDSYQSNQTAALGHTEKAVAGYAATCTATGLTDGSVCSVCSEVLTAQEVIPALGHTAEAVPGKAATCTATGLTDGSVCSVCGEVLTAQEVIPALGHTAEAVPGKAATCTATGLTDGSICSVCGEVLTAQEVIPALGHTAKAVPGKAATCTETGLTEGSVCSVCGEVLTAQEVIPALGHNYTSSVKVPTCEEDGLRTYTCANCGDTYSETIPATGHTAEAVPGTAATCTATGLTEGSICSVCQKVLVAQEEIPMVAHSYANGVCSVCGAKDPDYVAPDPSLKQGLQKADDGNYYYYIDGVVQESFTGLVDNAVGRWYIANGMAQMSFDGVIEYEGTNYLIKAGCVNTAYTDLYRIEGGRWLYFVQGVQDTEFVGLITRLGMQAYVEDGEVNFNKTAIVEHNGNLVFVKYGIFRDTFVGLYRDDAGEWLYFVNGVFDPTYTGVAALNSMWVYVEDGYVNFSFSGTITVGAYDYVVKYGVVQL